MRRLIFILGLLLFTNPAFAALEYALEYDESLFDASSKVFDAELNQFSCNNTTPEPFAECASDFRPSMEVECTAVFRVISKLKGDVKLSKYLHIPFKTVSSYSPSCPFDPTRHLFFKDNERIRIFQSSSGNMKFLYTDSLSTRAFVTMPDTDRVPVSKAFPDIENKTCKDLFNFFYWRGAITGFPDGTARPNQEVNRAEFLAVLTRLIGLQDEAKNAKYRYINDQVVDTANGNIRVGLTDRVYFPDVFGVDWFSEFVALGLEKRWVNGFADGTFKPNQTIEFVEGLKITLQAFEIPIVKSAEDIKLPWYEPYLRTARTINGITFFDYNKKLTRCEILSLIESVEREYLKQKYEQDL